jgi:hypothetical protein
MDDIVRQAMAKWPRVPDCYGWLGLDARGQWTMRDDRVQACGSFSSGLPGSKGSVLRHEKLLDFIGRNYACDDKGCWFFQNGPQRVYVELEVAPWIWRLEPTGQIRAHCGQSAQYVRALVDENGWMFLETTLGLGLVHTQDVGDAAHLVDLGQWQVNDVRRSELSQRYGFVPSPQSLALTR